MERVDLEFGYFLGKNDNREYTILGGILFALSLASFALKWTDPQGYLYALGPNLLAGFLGSAVTVFGFDVILRRRRERLNLPIRTAIYYDVCVLSKTPMLSMVKNCDPRLASLYGWRHLLHEALRYSFINDDKKWAEDIREGVAQTLERYIGYLEPRTVGHLQRIAGADYTQLGSRGIRIPLCVPIHHASDDIAAEWANSIVALHEWTWREREKLAKAGVRNIRAPFVPLAFPSFAPAVNGGPSNPQSSSSNAEAPPAEQR